MTGQETEPREMLPRGLGDIFDEAFDLYKANFGLFAGIVAAITLPVAILNQAMGLGFGVYGLLERITNQSDATIPDFGALLGLLTYGLLAALLATVAWTIESGALTVAVSRRFLGETVTVRQAYRAARARLLRLLGAWTIVSIVVGGLWGLATYMGMVVIVFIGIALQATGPAGAGVLTAVLVAYSVAAVLLLLAALSAAGIFTTQIIVVEDAAPTAVLQRNWSLCKGRIPRVTAASMVLALVLLVLQFGILYSVQFAVGLAIGPWIKMTFVAEQVLANGITTFVTIVLHPYAMVAITLLYYDMRIRREGYDLTVLERSSSGADTTSEAAA